MSRFELSCPGKFFLLGEYASIVGGDSLLLTTAPRFKAVFTKSADGLTKLPQNISPQSPAGVFLLSRIKSLSGWNIEFHDPNETTIGSGSSSAQFVLSYAGVAKIEGKPQPKAAEMLEAYWHIVGESQGLKPSGADLVAQFCGGGAVHVHGASAKTLSGDSGARIIFVFTGKKQRTHEHLKALKARGFPEEFSNEVAALKKFALQGVDAWTKRDVLSLAHAMNDAQAVMDRAYFGDSAFASLVQRVRSLQGVLAAKGSGAQGGDCLVLLIDPAATSTVCDELIGMGLSPFEPKLDQAGLI